MQTDITIANNAKLENISTVFNKLVPRDSIKDDIEQYGKSMAKIPLSYINEDNIKKSHLILVTSISPTSAGIGKTTVSIGLNDAMRTINKKSVAVLREPSLGPCFGMKGGACGGGYSQVIPMDKINLHFTGDFHAITAANNMIAAAIDNYFYHNPEELSYIKKITFKRCVDINDRSLRTIYTKNKYGNLIETGFNITPASEIMAIFCLAKDLDDLRNRINNIIIAENIDGSFMYCAALNITGSIIALLSDAIKPNLVQSLANNPVIIHGGPFANIAHGCNTVIATKMGLSLADYVITEAGFGSDLGAEKFWDIKCRQTGLIPDVVVIVVTIPGLKNQGGAENIYKENIQALNIGLRNLRQHITWLKNQGHNIIVSNNSYESDTLDEQQMLEKFCEGFDVQCVKNTCYSENPGIGALKLALEVDKLINTGKKSEPEFVYYLTDTLKEKISKVVSKIYGMNSDKIIYSKAAETFINKHGEEFLHYPICIAKTQYSFSDDPKELPIPSYDSNFHVDDIQINNGAGFLVVIAGNMMRMPGLPKKPLAMKIDYKNDKIIGLS